MKTWARTAAVAIALAMFTFAPTLLAAVIYVDLNATKGANNGTSWQDAFLDLHDGLAAAQSGDEIRVGQGTYKPAPPGGSRDATFTLVNGVLLQGGFAGVTAPIPDEWNPEQYPTILSGDLNGDDGPNFQNYGDNSYNVLFATGTDASTTLRGLTIRGGNANLQSGSGFDRRGWGGAISSPLNNPSAITLLDCVVRDNRAYEGAGGLYMGGGVHLHRSIFRGNITIALAVASGGAVVAWNVASTIVDCTFESNSAANTGGALSVTGTTAAPVIIRNCRFFNNGAVEEGGAVNGHQLVVIDCDLISNGSQHWGGAMGGYNTTVINSRFLNNGVGCYGWSGSAITSYGGYRIINCLFSGNGGGSGAFVKHHLVTSPDEIINSSFVGNWSLCGSAGIVTAQNTTVANCIIWDNNGSQNTTQANQIKVTPTTVLMNNTIQGWDGTLGGMGNSGADPLMIDPAGPDGIYGTEDDNPRLSDASPARDSGGNSLLPLDEFDLDGDGVTNELLPIDLDGLRRIVNGIVDRGAYEWQRPAGCEADVYPSLPGVAGDGVINVNDLLTIINNWGSCDQCVADIDNDGLVNVNDLLAVITAWGKCP
jgi:predicted outer membrane repeat protein